jgi:hypothetical protein
MHQVTNHLNELSRQVILYDRDSQPFLNGDTLNKTSAIPWHPTHGETPTPTVHSIRKENT